MVFLTAFLARGHLYRGADKYFKQHQRFRIAWRYEGRSRNVNRLTRIAYMRALRFAFWGRSRKNFHFRELYDTRLEGAAMEHGMSRPQLLEGLARSDVLLDRKVLQDLAIYEPRTFKSLCDLSRARLLEDGVFPTHAGDSPTHAGDSPSQHVNTRGLLHVPVQPGERGL